MSPGSHNIGFLGSDDVDRFEKLLAECLAESSALCIFLLDRAGRLLSSCGDRSGIDETTFASLASADFAASTQLATLLGEDEFAALYHHGEERSMFLADIGGAAILAVLFDTRTTLGMVRIKTKMLVPAFAEHFTRLAADGPSGQVVQMESDWASEAGSEIDRLFKD
jgi:predicted regulator of Ras-like GTPase activity (Roadblock/LC7/MglB family)